MDGDLVCLEAVLRLGDGVALFTGKPNEQRGSPHGLADVGDRLTRPDCDGVGLGPPEVLGVDDPSMMMLGLDEVDTDFNL
jgi:hypothetical protein